MLKKSSLMKIMKVMKTMSEDLEFHYVVSFREGYGWQHAIDVEQAVMTDGTIYDWTQGQGWKLSFTDSEDPEESRLDTLDRYNYSLLLSALHSLNKGEITNA